MLSTKETLGTREQEKLIFALAGIIEQYVRKKKGTHHGTDSLVILGQARITMKKLLPVPFPQMLKMTSSHKEKLFGIVINEIVDHYQLQEWKDDIDETCLFIWGQWKDDQHAITAVNDRASGITSI